MDHHVQGCTVDVVTMVPCVRIPWHVNPDTGILLHIFFFKEEDAKVTGSYVFSCCSHTKLCELSQIFAMQI